MGIASSAASRLRVHPGSRRDRGVSSLELAIFAPVILVLVWLMVQAALYMFALSLASSAAQWGVNDVRGFTPEQMASGTGAQARQDIDTHAKTFAGTLLKGAHGELDYNRTQAGRVTVTVTGHSVTLFGFNLPEIKKHASAEIEGFHTDCPTGQCPDLEGIPPNGG